MVRSFFVYPIFVKNILYYWFFSPKFALNTQNKDNLI